jgi:maltose/maltodextrin transport system substrate-binding protein/arabinogalactan oligomer/maltooligosaccharide transport system substrate-binding protein
MKHKNLTILFVLLLIGALVLSACSGTTAEQQAEEAVQQVEEAAEEAAEQAGEAVDAAATEAAEAAMHAEETAEAMAAEAEAAMHAEETAVAEAAAAAAEEAAAEPTEAPTEEAAADSGLSLTIWADNTRAPILQDLAAGFEEEYGVTLVVEELGFGDIRDQLTIAGPAGEGPDIIVGAHDWLGELVSNGVLAPIDLGDKVADFAPAAIDAFTYDGELYGMPNATENVALFINTDIVPECPATWTEVAEISAELAANNTDDVATNKYGFVRMEGDPYHFFPIQTAFGGYVFGQGEAGYDAADVGIDNEGSLAAAAWYDEFVKAGLQPPAVDWETMHLMFESGQSAMTITGPWAVTRITDSGVPYAICPIPGEVNEHGQPFLGAQGFMVSAFAKDPLLAQIFLTEFVATPEVMQAFYDADPRVPAYLPVLEALDDPNIAAFGEAGVDALPMPAIPEMASVWDAWGNAIVLISQQGDDATNAFTNAAEQIRTAIAESN